MGSSTVSGIHTSSNEIERLLDRNGRRVVVGDAGEMILCRSVNVLYTADK